jgi:hypothetical protein
MKERPSCETISTPWTRCEEQNYDELAQGYMQETLGKSVSIHFGITSDEKTLTSPSMSGGGHGRGSH